MSGDRELREQLAEALRVGWHDGTPFVVSESEGRPRVDFGRYADVLLPLVLADREQYGARRAAEELEAVRRWIVQSGNASGPVMRFLRSRADVSGRLGRRR